ncbi:hypothetical protein [Aporhodopirellula aestuarii]|uniref:Uncharacterized protein n=1 Tax=Aporhodopirellula aestuarii TaxID=2950107 RepID=A0ABT0TWN4_9BACT|nr:hypothetical protein [Aporhodopirellula aestuarii]MCM2369028.1 hypothetical protein [Aporhodopirellula aestuarii]
MTLVVVGAVFSIQSNWKLSGLRKTHSKLREQAGFLDVEDPSKVAVSFVPFDKDDIPPGVEQAYVWRYRIHFPANYGTCYKTQRGLVKADSPQGRGGSGSSWSSPKPAAEVVLATMALLKTDGKWIFCRSVGGGSSTSSLPKDFNFEDLDNLVFEPLVSPGDKTRTFETDEAICLIRVREKQLAKKRRGGTEDGLYRGISVYVFNSNHKDAFEAWAKGNATSMKEAMP